MKLTVIKIRGKKQPKEVILKRRAAKDADGPSDKKRVKRRHHAKHGEAIGGGMMRRRKPRLSDLPQEILERVFLASKNLSLPLVNRALRRRLSSNSIKWQLVGAAFGPTWNAWYGLDNTAVVSYDGWISDAERIEGDPTFQSAILACSWAKFPLLLDSFDVWIRQQADSRIYFTIPELKEQRLRIAPQPGSLHDRAYNTALGTPNGPGLSTMPMREKINWDFQLFLERFSAPIPGTPASGALTESGDFYLRALLTTHLEIHPGTTIPDDVLAGPFESDDGDVRIGEEKMSRLFWLVRGGACLQDEQNWEITDNGFTQILQLIQGADAVGMREQDIIRRLQLATRLIALFGILGVFNRQWPKYIVQTNMLRVREVAHQVPPDSEPRLLFIDLISKLQCPTGGEDFGSPLGWRWRRWRPQDAKRHDSRALRQYWAVIRRQISMQRARFFLLAPDCKEEEPFATLAVNDGLGLPLGHWLEFGPDPMV